MSISAALRALPTDVLFAACHLRAPFSQNSTIEFFLWPNILSYPFFLVWLCFSPPIASLLERSISEALVLYKPCFCCSPMYVLAPLAALIYCDALIPSVIPSLVSHRHPLAPSRGPLDTGALLVCGWCTYQVRDPLCAPVIRHHTDIMHCVAYTHSYGHVSKRI